MIEAIGISLNLFCSSGWVKYKFTINIVGFYGYARSISTKKIDDWWSRKNNTIKWFTQLAVNVIYSSQSQLVDLEQNCFKLWFAYGLFL